MNGVLIGAMIAHMDAFWEYLAARVNTSNMDILQQISREFHCGKAGPTLAQFVELAISLIAILPIDIADVAARKRAAVLLQQQQNASALQDCNGSVVNACLERDVPVLKFLKTSVVTKNLAWLEQMHADFVAGREDTLQRFVSIGSQGIAILPHWLPVPMPATMPAPALPSVAAAAPSLSTTVGASSTDTKPPRPRAKRARHEMKATPSMANPQLPIEGNTHDLELAIQARVRALEATEPWTIVYGANLPCPYPDHVADAPRTEWRQFWDTHGQAVWERFFWTPFSGPAEAEAQLVRRRRQQNLIKAIERLLVLPCFARLGAQFFVDLDTRAELHAGWYYRTESIDLLRLARVHGVDACWQYLDTQHLERFPRLPDGDTPKLLGRISISMHSLTAACLDVASAIYQLKHPHVDLATIKRTLTEKAAEHTSLRKPRNIAGAGQQ